MGLLDETKPHLDAMHEHINEMRRDLEAIRRYAIWTEVLTVAALVLALGIIVALAVLGWK